MWLYEYTRYIRFTVSFLEKTYLSRMKPFREIRLLFIKHVVKIESLKKRVNKLR